VPANASVCLAGRVVEASEAGFTLQDDTGCVLIEAANPPSVGSLVRVTGHYRDRRVCELAELLTLHTGSAEFARADSDWTFLTGSRLANLRMRHTLLQATRAFLDGEGLLEVETPAIVPCPGLDVHLDAIEVLGARGPRWLHTSPEYQMKRLLSTTLPGIYQIGKAFRRGERGRLHEPEFTLLEWYRCLSDAAQMRRDTEQLVAHVTQRLLGDTKLRGVEAPVDVTPPWDCITVERAFDRYAGVTLDSVVDDDERFFRILVEKVEPELGRGRPVFLTHYPARMASLARLLPDDSRFGDRFEAYLDGIELCNGFSELIDPVEQRKRLEADRAAREKLGRSVYPIDERFMATLNEGIPPSGGNALGFDRLLMLVTGATHIDQVLAFPVSRT
jgi:lysyl-tRNA synthetase class 2